MPPEAEKAIELLLDVVADNIDSLLEKELPKPRSNKDLIKFAASVGTSRTTLQRILRGSKQAKRELPTPASIDTLMRLALHFRVPVWELLKPRGKKAAIFEAFQEKSGAADSSAPELKSRRRISSAS